MRLISKSKSSGLIPGTVSAILWICWLIMWSHRHGCAGYCLAIANFLPVIILFAGHYYSKRKPSRTVATWSAAILLSIIAVLALVTIDRFTASFYPTFNGSPRLVKFFPFTDLSITNVEYYYNPPGFMGDGVSYAICKLDKRDLTKWIIQFNKKASNKENIDKKNLTAYESFCSQYWKPFTKGPLVKEVQIDAVRYVFSYQNERKEVDRLFDWHKLVKSDKCYFMFDTLKYEADKEGKASYSDVSVWILDTRTHKMYHASVGV